jgi:hypothetical protein
MTTRTTFRTFVSLLALACSAIPVSAALTTYSTLSSFNSATSSQTFSNITFPSGSDGTSYTDIASQVVFSSANGLTGIPTIGTWPAGSSLEVLNSGSTNVLTITLPSLVTSVSLYLGPQNFSNFNIDVANTGGGTYDNGAEEQSSGTTPVFFGVTSDSAFSTFTVTTFASVDHLVIDGVEIGTSGSDQAQTPEVATFLMIGGGLLMLRYGRRWLPRV